MSSAVFGFKKGGVHPPEHKQLSCGSEIVEVAAPKMLTIPVSQHLGRPSRCVVSKGEVVTVGQALAEADGPISSQLHSPVSGKVLKVFNGPVVGSPRSPLIQIMNDGKFEGAHVFDREPKVVWGNRQQFLDKLREAGIVGMGGAAFPTQVKLHPPKDASVDTLIINGCECEPYLTADDVLMRVYPAQVLSGVAIMAAILNVPTVHIGIESNKPEAIQAVQEAIEKKSWKTYDDGPGPDLDIQLMRMRTRYPQGAEKQLIDAVLGRKVPSGKLPFAVGVVVQNVGTCLGVFEAVALDKPLIERVVTVSGRAVVQPGNFRARLGTPISALVEAAGGATPALRAIVAGGPMMGKSLRAMDVPVVKGMSGILLLSEEETAGFVERDCIRCGRCVETCPMRLAPCDMAAACQFEKWDRLDGVMDCVECGSCQYVCPARRNLVQWLRFGKFQWRKNR